MKEKDEMYSVSEILKSKEFEQIAPPELPFQVRKYQRETSTTAERPSRKETHSIKDIDRRRYR